MLAYTKDKSSRCGILLDGKLRDNFRSANQSNSYEYVQYHVINLELIAPETYVKQKLMIFVSIT